MEDSGDDPEVKPIVLPVIYGFSDDEVALVHQMCDLYYSVPQMAKSMGVHEDKFFDNPEMMEFIRDILLSSEMDFIKSVRLNALQGDKNALEIIFRRIHNAKSISHE